MVNTCSECGAELIEDSKFCSKCGKKFEQPTEKPTEPEPKQEYEHLQSNMPPLKTPKSKKKLILGISALIIAVVIVAVFLVVLLGGTSPFNSADNRFVGEWEQNTIDSPILWNFNSDSTLQTESNIGMMNNVGKWTVTGNQLCLYDNAVCYTYEFSNNRNTLTLKIIEVSDDYSSNIILTKKGAQGTTQTPNIECTIDAATNRIRITFIDPEVKWSDINISTNPASPTAKWQVQDTNQQGLARIGTTDTIATYVTAGDNILVLEAIGDVTVILKFTPTNEILGNWTVNV